MSGSTAPLGIGILGTGFGQKVHLPGFEVHHGTQVVAIYHREKERAKAIAQAHHLPHACATVEELVALPEVQAVSIATPPFLHFEMAKKVLEAGKPLLLEKPTTLTAEEARILYQLAEAKGIVTAMDFEYRFVPAWQYLAELLATGYVGKPYFICINWLMGSRADAQRPWNWYARKDQGGGALGALGSHAFDSIAWLFGPVHRLQAHLATAIPERPDPETQTLKPVDADDTCLISLELADGTPCQVNISSVARNGRGYWLEVYGDKGTIVLGSSNQQDYVHGFKLWAAPAGQELAEKPIPKHWEFSQTYPDGRLAPFIRVVDQWVKGIEQGQGLAPTFKEGVYSQLLMDASDRSHETGSWVTVPDLETFLAG
jgi:predicted dehydrogenase